MVESDGICPNCRSSGAVTSEAMVSGLAPGSCVVIWMVGKSTCGSAETGRRTKPRTPHSITAKPSSDVAIGRSMKGVETLIATGRPLAAAPGLDHCPSGRCPRWWRPMRSPCGPLAGPAAALAGGLGGRLGPRRGAAGESTGSPLRPPRRSPDPWAGSGRPGGWLPVPAVGSPPAQCAPAVPSVKREKPVVTTCSGGVSPEVMTACVSF